MSRPKKKKKRSWHSLALASLPSLQQIDTYFISIQCQWWESDVDLLLAVLLKTVGPPERMQSKPHEHMRRENLRASGDCLWGKVARQRTIDQRTWISSQHWQKRAERVWVHNSKVGVNTPWAHSSEWLCIVKNCKRQRFLLQRKGCFVVMGHSLGWSLLVASSFHLQLNSDSGHAVWAWHGM